MAVFKRKYYLQRALNFLSSIMASFRNSLNKIKLQKLGIRPRNKCPYLMQISLKIQPYLFIGTHLSYKIYREHSALNSRFKMYRLLM